MDYGASWQVVTVQTGQMFKATACDYDGTFFVAGQVYTPGVIPDDMGTMYRSPRTQPTINPKYTRCQGAAGSVLSLVVVQMGDVFDRLVGLI